MSTLSAYEIQKAFGKHVKDVEVDHDLGAVVVHLRDCRPIRELTAIADQLGLREPWLDWDMRVTCGMVLRATLPEPSFEEKLRALPIGTRMLVRERGSSSNIDTAQVIAGDYLLEGINAFYDAEDIEWFEVLTPGERVTR